MVDYYKAKNIELAEFRKKHFAVPSNTMADWGASQELSDQLAYYNYHLRTQFITAITMPRAITTIMGLLDGKWGQVMRPLCSEDIRAPFDKRFDGLRMRIFKKVKLYENNRVDGCENENRVDIELVEELRVLDQDLACIRQKVGLGMPLKRTGNLSGLGSLSRQGFRGK